MEKPGNITKSRSPAELSKTFRTEEPLVNAIGHPTGVKRCRNFPTVRNRPEHLANTRTSQILVQPVLATLAYP